MKNFVITISENNKSVEAAARCVASGEQHGLEIEYYDAFTPKDCRQFISEQKINDRLFNNDKFSREDNARAAFCSHFSIWQYCADRNEEVTIFEHDAVLVAPIPEVNYNGCISFGKPSYGKFNTPPNIGTNRLVSKRYFPGAHAYRMKPNAAKVLVDAARLEARPTDLFLNIEAFPFLEEYYPWPVEVRETFSTIQKKEGCLAKHMFNEKYTLEDV
jgi:GR25 family glycosyltransferase involved in LPS biosynthesis